MEHDINPPFKKPAKKYEPRGLSILFEDKFIIVVKKANGLLALGTTQERNGTAQTLLNQYVKRGNAKSPARVYMVHRLDRDTSGVLLFAKDERTKRNLQDGWDGFTKKFLTIVNGQMDNKEGVITSSLTENAVGVVYSAREDQEGEESKTGFKVLKENEKYSLVEVELMTDYKHQVRVHMAEQGNPVAGDRVYGEGFPRVKRLALHAVSLTIVHPVTRRKITFQTDMPNYFKEFVKA